MKVTLLLCDYAQVAGGKLTAVGAGWSLTSPLTSHAVGILLDVPWDLANVRMPWSLELRDADGAPVVKPGSTGEVPVRAGGEVEVGRPAGTPPGTPISVCFAIPVHGLVLQPSSRYGWEFSVDGRTRDDWACSTSSIGATPTTGDGPPAPIDRCPAMTALMRTGTAGPSPTRCARMPA